LTFKKQSDIIFKLSQGSEREPQREASRKKFKKRLKKGIDKRGTMWYNRQAAEKKAANGH